MIHIQPITFSFNLVNAFSIDASGNIYVLDSYNERVTKWAPGASTGILVAGGNGQGVSLNTLSSPSGFYVESNTSTIWISDSVNCRIVKWIFPSTGVFVCGSYGSKADQFNYPQGLFVDTSASNTFYVADTDNHRIQMWLPGAINGTTVAGQTGVAGNGLNQLNYPQTLLVDRNGIMYIMDAENSRIMQWTIGSTFGVCIAGTTTHGVLPNQLFGPQSFRFDSTGALIVADNANNRIQKFPVVCCKF
jgi:sugar lactone lactonase YvrE